MRRFVEEYSRPGVEPQLVVNQGHASDLILSFAQTHDIDGIVTGTHVGGDLIACCGLDD